MGWTGILFSAHAAVTLMAGLSRPLLAPLAPSLLVILLQALFLTWPSSLHFLSPSLPVLQCDVTITELMCRILRVQHSSFPTHTAQMKATADTHGRSLEGVTTSQHLYGFSHLSSPSVPYSYVEH